MNTKSKLTYGTVELDDEDFLPANVRRRISIMIPEDVIAKLTAMGAKTGEGYQTVINRLLREAVSESEHGKIDKTSDALVASVSSTMKKIEQRFEEFTRKRIDDYLSSRLTVPTAEQRAPSGKIKGADSEQRMPPGKISGSRSAKKASASFRIKG